MATKVYRKKCIPLFTHTVVIDWHMTADLQRQNTFGNQSSAYAWMSCNYIKKGALSQPLIYKKLAEISLLVCLKCQRELEVMRVKTGWLKEPHFIGKLDWKKTHKTTTQTKKPRHFVFIHFRCNRLQVNNVNRKRNLRSYLQILLHN